MAGRVIASGLTQDRTFAFPDANGTIVVTGSSPSLTAVALGDGSSVAPCLSRTTTPGLGLYFPNAFGFAGVGQGTTSAYLSFGAAGSIQQNSAGYFGWTATADAVAGAVDLSLFRDAANTLAQRNGTNAQAFRLYNTFTDVSNYERAEIFWSGNNFSIQTNQAGTGSSRGFQVGTQGTGAFSVFTKGTTRWIVNGSTGALTANAAYNFSTAGSILGTGPTLGVGYGTGAGGSVTQATSKSTGVTLNTVTGQITMQAAALAAAAKVSFVVTDSAAAATDTIIVAIASGGTANAYRANVTAIAAGSFTVTVENITAGSLSEAPVINFAVIKGVAS